MKLEWVLPFDQVIPDGYMLAYDTFIRRNVDLAMVQVCFNPDDESDGLPDLAFISGFDQAWRLQGMKYNGQTGD
jgi:hypothetical protein